MHQRLYDARLPLEPSYPANRPSEGDSVPMRRNVQRKISQNGLREDRLTEHLQHAPPGSESQARARKLAISSY